MGLGASLLSHPDVVCVIQMLEVETETIALGTSVMVSTAAIWSGVFSSSRNLDNSVDN